MAPEQGYGPRDERLVQIVPRTKFGEVEESCARHAGALLERPAGAAHRDASCAWIAISCTIDGNHPLAGRTLHFSVEIAEVRKASHEEVAHGHVHGPDGHHH